MMIRVMHVGLGPIGAAVARQVAGRRGFKLVAAVDIDPDKVGRDVGDVVGLDRRLRVKVTPDLAKTLRASKPDVAVVCTGSSLSDVLPQRARFHWLVSPRSTIIQMSPVHTGRTDDPEKALQRLLETMVR